jgi:hypothetical protein
MPYTVTDVQIFNRALARLGSGATVSAVDGTDASQWGTLAGLEFQATRNEELKTTPWRFAIQRALLVANTTASNLTGFWYVYNVPDDCLRVIFLYQILPQFITTYPTKIIHVSLFPFTHENDLLFTDADSANANPYIKYIRQLPLGTAWSEPLFVDALAMRIASKIAAQVTNDPNHPAKTGFQQEYMALIQRAKANNALDLEDDLPTQGEIPISDRGQWTGSWGSGG